MKLHTRPPANIGHFLIVAFLALSGSGAAADPNPAPPTMPSLREWTGGTGSFTLASNALITIDGKYTNQLIRTALVLEDDLKQFTGADHRVVVQTGPQPGELFLTLENSDAGVGVDGYVLQIGNNVVIRANTDNGVFYGTQTLLQILKLEATHSILPQGTARDYPLCKERDELIDCGRRFYQVSYLEEEIRKLAWYKLDTLQLHFADWNGFRLVSDTYPGLATSPAYTKADIRRIQDVAKRYHVTIVPIIDMPAHCKTMTDYNPKLHFPCASMDTGHWAGSENGGWMLDITRPEVRAWIKALLDEFIPEFDGPYFHIGCDEWEFTAQQNACPELVAYMKAKGYASPTDVFVEWINEVNKQVRSYGKTMQIWNWWDYKQSTSIQPNKDIVINVWTSSPDWFLRRGWKVIGSLEDGPDSLYVVPGFGTLPGQFGYFDSKRIYEAWKMPADTNLMGFKLCRWSDNAEARSDAWFDYFAQRPLQVFAERVWGGPRSASVNEFYERVDAIGAPPQVPTFNPK